MKVSKQLHCMFMYAKEWERKVIGAFLEQSESSPVKTAALIHSYMCRKNARFNLDGVPLGTVVSSEQMRKGIAYLRNTYILIKALDTVNSLHPFLQREAKKFMMMLAKVSLQYSNRHCDRQLYAVQKL